MRDTATIRYSVPYAVHVNLKVYDVSGRMVTKLVDGEVDPGLHTLRWEGKDDINRRCASGVYFVRFAAEDYVASKKMVLLK
jgi:flagellar hook assembly protein FlgD